MAVTGLTRNQFIGFNAGTRVRIPPSPFKTMKMPDIVWHFHRFLRTPYGACYFLWGIVSFETNNVSRGSHSVRAEK